MKVLFRNPGYEYMIDSIMEHQQDDTTPYWNDALFYFHENLSKEHAYGLSIGERKKYFYDELKKTYESNLSTLSQKVADYQNYWDQNKGQIEAALSEAFNLDCSTLLNDVICNITLNPVCPRYLEERRFDMFYLNSEKGALGISIHELIHFVWFIVWNELFKDSYDEYETPSLKWILSELVVESIMDDPRLSSINPYYPREHGGCIYSYFYTMIIDGKPITETIRQMYATMDIHAFMKESYDYCQRHEKEIRAHIQNAEQEWP